MDVMEIANTIVQIVVLDVDIHVTEVVKIHAKIIANGQVDNL